MACANLTEPGSRASRGLAGVFPQDKEKPTWEAILRIVNSALGASHCSVAVPEASALHPRSANLVRAEV